MMLRKALAKAGLRYRLHRKDLAGNPDIVFAGLKLAVFVDGDFWHGRGWVGRRARLEGVHNSDYWIRKIEANMRRDRRKRRELTKLGWRVLRFWEGEILRDAQFAASKIANELTSRAPVPPAFRR